MCGQIRCSASPEQALDFALAYARNNLTNTPDLADEYDVRAVRREATEYINVYAPEAQRSEALRLLSLTPNDNLTTTTEWFYDVVHEAGEERLPETADLCVE